MPGVFSESHTVEQCVTKRWLVPASKLWYPTVP